MHPLKILTGGLTNLLALGLIALDIYLFKEWYQHRYLVIEKNYDERCLVIACALLFILVFGQFVMGFFLGKSGMDEPKAMRSKRSVELKRPEGSTLHVEFFGPEYGQNIIFLHGWSSNSTQWYYFKKSLELHYRLLLVDLPGLGKSSKVENNDYSLEKFAGDLQAVIDLCGGNKPILVGHSIGGMTILTACKLEGQGLYHQISGIALLNTTYINPCRTSILSGLLTALHKPVLTPMLYVMIAFAPIFQLMNWLKLLNGSMHLSNHLSGFAGTETRGQLSLTAYLSAIAPVDVISRGCLAMFKYDATEVLSSINTPVLIVTGDKDILTKKEASVFMAQRIPDAQLIELSPSAHMGVLERHQEMIAAVEKFARAVLPFADFKKVIN